MGELEVGAVRTSLVPALDSSTDGTRGNGQVQDERYTPSVKDLIAQGFNLGVVKGFIASDVFITGRVLGDECALANEVTIIVETFYATEFICLG